MRKISTILLAAALMLATVDASAKLNLNKTISDGMVLQQQTNARIWGKADAGQKVSLYTSWDSKSYSAKADADGKWEVFVKTPAASYTKYRITVSAGNDRQVINDVLVGEVWMASGQSNMEMQMRGFYNCPVENASEYIAAAPMPDKIRMFTVDIYEPAEPVDDVYSSQGWQKASPATVPDMSATAYFFALQLSKSLDVPIGIVAFARGGARVESWLPRETLAAWGDELSPEAIKKMSTAIRPFQDYNGMEQAVKGYTSKGFIWYQGCSNVGADKVFVERMTELVRQWREDWGDKDNAMPFYMVEIAPFQYGNEQYATSPALRQAQHDAAKVIPNAGIIVTNDLVYDYEIKNIHPCKKLEVGNRLAYMALNRNYGFTRLVCDSPEAVRAFKEDGRAGEILVELSNCKMGVNRWIGIEGLEVSGADGDWKPVKYAYFEWGSHALRIRHDDISSPTQVRYGWGNFKPGNLANAEGLGVAPFWIRLGN